MRIGKTPARCCFATMASIRMSEQVFQGDRRALIKKRSKGLRPSHNTDPGIFDAIVGLAGAAGRQAGKPSAPQDDLAIPARRNRSAGNHDRRLGAPGQ